MPQEYQQEYQIAYWLVITTNPQHLTHADTKLTWLYWLLKLLPNNYRHCYALGYIPDINGWIFINPNSHDLDISILAVNEDLLLNILRMYQQKKCDYRLIDPAIFDAYQQIPRWNIRLFMSCATILAHHIGIPTRWGAPYTPKGLLKTLDKYQSQYNQKEK